MSQNRRLLYLSVMLLFFGMQTGAKSQNVAPFGFTLGLDVGVEVYVNMGGAGLWHGVTTDGVDAADFGAWVRGIAPWAEKNATVLPRNKVKYVCPEHCGRNLTGDAPNEDTVVWKDGTKTTGRIEVRCGDYNSCSVYQNGKIPHKNANWSAVDYAYLASR